MKGLALMASVAIQLVVASTKAAERAGPSGSMPQAAVAQTATMSSVAMPATDTCSRWRASFRRQASLVSV